LRDNYRQTDTDRQTNKQTQATIETDRQADKQTQTETSSDITLSNGQ